ncbi:ABC transporter ATP-binding protein [Paraferrimonas sp. SM1919]|uniref:ABC transporter ATP-binding protein n=1 Tax=Paraferrimonas sp. SM1919 TaxID=2662263 RepID=UPI0013D840DC|nr:ABC transporter ATP-binding protein [Paraferrimonas sp. SM1919]
MISINQVQLLRGSKSLLDEASSTIFPGHKVGLVGANGCGKSSLFALLQGKLQADKGECQLPSDWQLASVAQETPALDTSAIEYVIDGDHEYRQLQQKLELAQNQNNGEKIALIHGQIDAIGGYAIHARAAELLAGLGFSQSEQNQPLKSFSGGWRMRLNLAQALLCRSDLLLLDEPTNHLDLDTIYWLESWLKQYQGTLILISHDRDFLDNVVSEIIHIEHQKLNNYKGGYSAFERIRAEKLAQQQAQYEKQQVAKAHMQAYVDRFRYKASKAKQAQSRLKALEKMQDLLPAQADNPFSMNFLPPQSLPNPLVSMENISAGYGDNIILKSIKMNLTAGARIGLLGRNGAGKSTFIKLLSGQLAPISGVYQASPGLSIGYFAQHQLETLRVEDSPINHLQRLAPLEREQKLRDFLGGFGFSGDKATSAVGPFSGGEKARLVLALLVWQKPNLLLLDEPTNHLDLEMRHALTMALAQFEGAMIIVSHDRHLLKACCDDFYLVDNQQIAPFTGDLEDYHSWLLESAKSAKSSLNSATKNSVSQDKKELKRQQAELRKQLSPLKKSQQTLEQQQAKLTEQLNNIEQQLADNSLYSEDNKNKLKQLLLDQASLKEQLEESELDWLDLQQQIENIEAQ